MGACRTPGIAYSGPDGVKDFGGLGGYVRSPGVFPGDLRGSGAISWNLLPGGELATARAHYGPRQRRPDGPAKPIDQRSNGLCRAPALPPVAERGREMKPAIERIELSMEELERLLERARVEPLPEEDYQKLKAAVDTLEYLTELVADKDTTIRHLRQLLLPASTEKTKDVLAKAGAAAANPATEIKPEDGQEQPRAEAQPGHGR